MRDVYDERFARSAWWRHDRFGMFIHWGAYAVPARGEWVRSTERMSTADYERYIDAFVPDVDFDEWARLAQDAGMRYAILTAKHHDGYCLFDSATTDYTSVNRGPRRDLVAGFLEAFRARGIKVGLYFSLIDWSRPDYPHYRDRHHPMRGNPEFAEHVPDLASYRAFMHAQVRELCTNYGPLDAMWFDFSYDDMANDAWDAAGLMAMVRELQPQVITDDRLETSAEARGSIVTERPTPYCGDFIAPEQTIPLEALTIWDGSPAPWESCITLNNHWGYHAGDREWKSAQTVIRTLVECVSKGGNLLLNVGPDARGHIPDACQSILREVGGWLADNGESIYGAGNAHLPKPDWGRYTARDDRLFAHVVEQPIGPLPLVGFPRGSVSSARLIASGAEVAVTDTWVANVYPETTFLSLGADGAFTYPLPDPRDTVVELTLAKP